MGRSRRILQAVAEDEPPTVCADLGAAIGRSAMRTGLLVMGDGSARRSVRAPGHLYPRAATFDAETEHAFREGDFDALLAISPGLARELTQMYRRDLTQGARPSTPPASTSPTRPNGPGGPQRLCRYWTTGE